MVFVIFARVEVKLEHYDSVMEKARAIAKYCQEEELETLTYQWALKKEEDKAYFYTFERFSSEKYFREVHCTSALFLDFVKYAEENGFIMRTEEAEEADFGFLARGN